MYKIVGIRFKPNGKIYNFDPGAFVLSVNDNVIVETEHGLSFGTVIVGPNIKEEDPKIPLKKVYRLANADDFIQLARNKEMEQQALAFCVECIHQLEIKMNLFHVESSFDSTKLTFFFTAEGRIDFRHLVKLLVKEYHIRIEMRQVGIRNQAKMCGGIGRCGRMLCCSLFLDKFEPVSIRMAKEQNLSLNPTKISGQCGRLMCCLMFENKVYQELKKAFPEIGTKVKTPQFKGDVVRHHLITNQVVIRNEEGLEIEVGLEQIIIED